MLLEQMTRFVLHELARRDGRDLDVDAVRPLLQRVDRDLLLIVSLRPFPRNDTVLPRVPWAGDEFSVEPPLRQRAALVVADVGDRREPAVIEEHRDAVVLDLDRAGRACEQLGFGAESVPVGHDTTPGERVAQCYIAAPMPASRARVGVIFFTVLIDLIGFGIVLPILPSYAQRFGAGGLGYRAIIRVVSPMQFVATALLGKASHPVGPPAVLLTTMFWNALRHTLVAVLGSYRVPVLSRL